MYREICQTELSEFHSTVWEKSPEVSTKYILLCGMAIIAILLYRISLNSMGKITKGVNKIHFTMLYGNHRYIIIENFTQQYGKNRQRCQQNTFYYAVWQLLLYRISLENSLRVLSVDWDCLIEAFLRLQSRWHYWLSVWEENIIYTMVHARRYFYY